MGYSINWEGSLRFVSELTNRELAHLSAYFGEDVRDHPDWGLDRWDDFTHLNLKLTPEFDGVEWDGSEKTNGMANMINFLIQEMQKIKPDFGLEGVMQGQGEEWGDKRVIRFIDGKAVEQRLKAQGEEVTCPHCEETFIPNATWE